MLDLFGWRAQDGAAFASHAAEGLAPARILAQHRSRYDLVCDAGELTGQLAGRLLGAEASEDLPAVGDFVAVAPRPGEGIAIIQAVLPRRSCFMRRAAGGERDRQVVAANIDVALVVASMTDLNPRRLERYLAAARAGGAEAMVVLTKSDLCAGPDEALSLAREVAGEAATMAASAVTGQGIAELAAALGEGRTIALLGSSGAGKSSLLNALAGETLMATGAVRQNDDRGRHTTTHRQLTRTRDGLLIIDTPGMRELGLVEAEAGVDAGFSDIAALAAQCRFRDCSHQGEPGCAVRAALEAGRLDEGRWRSWGKLTRELAHQARQDDRFAREAERRRWISISKANRKQMKTRDRDW